jgi:hypothetical protein
VMRTEFDTVTSDTTPSQTKSPPPPPVQILLHMSHRNYFSVDVLSWQMVQNSFCLLLADACLQIIKVAINAWASVPVPESWQVPGHVWRGQRG